MASEKDYTKYPFKVTLLVIVLMLGLGFIPPFTVGGVHFKRTNILSDIIKIDDGVNANAEADNAADLQFIEEMERREAEQRAADSLAALAADRAAAPREQSWTLGQVQDAAGDAAPMPVLNGQRVVRIEDYSQGEGVTIADFCRLLGTETGKRTVRIAFLGDSYIEGDILTADVREQLQTLYSGSGVGFVPFSNPLATNRPTIKHSFAGWDNYNLAQKKSAPEEFNDKFFVSGVLSVPVDGSAWAEYENTSYRKHISQCTSVRLVFENAGAAEIKLTLNDSVERRFTPDSSALVQQVRAGGIPISKVRVDVESGEGFIGYGVVMDGGRGVAVDNFSIRSNSGLALFGASAGVNGQIDRLLGYDLVVLQYGLNAMDPEIVNYAGYGENMRRMVNYMKRCFPRAAVLMLGVGDRSTTDGGEFVTMPAVEAMIKTQRAVAKDCGVAFWDLFTAMGGQNSMADFVEKGWAAKDYTHLSFGGGRHIAGKLVNALLYLKQEVEEADARQAQDIASQEHTADAEAADGAPQEASATDENAATAIGAADDPAGETGADDEKRPDESVTTPAQDASPAEILTEGVAE